MKQELLWLVGACAVGILTSCGGGSGTVPPPPPPPPAPVQITSPAPPSGTLNVSYPGFPLTASGGKPSYTWTWQPKTGEVLPPGLTLSNGTISGLPTQAGAYDVVINVADSQSPPAQTSAPYTIWVYDPSKLTITSVPPDGTAFVRYGSLHTVVVNGIRYTYTAFLLTATGGSGHYSWSGSGLPPGLSCCTLNSRNYRVTNVIFGTPTQPGTYQISLTVTDSQSSARTTTQFPLVIHNPPPPVVTDALLPIGTLNSPYIGFTFTATNGMPPITWSEMGALPSGMTFGSDGSLTGTPTVAESFPITVTAQDSIGQKSAPHDFTIQVPAKGFVPTSGMASQRVFHTATLLKDGRVLVVGADPGAPAELFTPGAGFAKTGAPVTPRGSQAAALLNDGKVLIAGGIYGSALSSAELYDPSSGTFTQTAGSMSVARISPTATLLKTGKVLITGGMDDTGTAIATAELFDPGTGSFTPTDTMADPRAGHTATLLNDGKVLIAGGYSLTSAVLYDPSTEKFVPTGSMITWRFNHTGTLLNDGRVLMAGGQGGDQNMPIAKAEVYDPSSGAFSVVGDMPFARENHTATLLSNGSVLVAGGEGGEGGSNTGSIRILSAAELFDPATGMFTRTADMTDVRKSYTATRLEDDEVLVTGGYDNSGSPVASAELYQ